MTEGILDSLRDICEDPALGAVRLWMEQHPAAPVVGYLPAYAPRELVYAAGGLAVGVWGGGARVEIIHGDAYYQSYICHLPRSVIEMAKKGVFEGFKGFVFPSICDVIRNLSGMWKLLFPRQWASYLDLPQNFDPGIGGKFYREELIRLSTLIRGAEPDEDYLERLREAIILTNRQRKALLRLQRFRRSFPHKAPIDEYYYLLRSALLLHPSEHTGLVERYLSAEIEGRDAKPLDNVRVVLVGAFCEQPPVGLLKTIERAGCYIVNDDLMLGLCWLTSPLREEGDPLESLVEGYLEKTGMAPFKYQGDKDRGEELVRLVHESKAEGVLFAAPSFCDPALLERPMLQEALKKAKIPFTSFKYSENGCQYQGIREMAGTFSDSLRLWDGEL